jgi:uncharacterized membrane protein YccC
VRSPLREIYASSGERAAPAYGVVTAVGVTAPLVVGVLTGHAGRSGLVALGAFYVAFAGPKGPYGARARSMLGAVVTVTVFTWLGGSLSGDRWLAPAVVPFVAALGAAVPWLGPTAALCTLVAAIQPATSPVLFDGFLEGAGGLWVSALLLAPWATHRLRPLRESLAGAAHAVADALDAVTEPGSWDESRGRAYDAVGEARATYALYRGGCRDEQQRPRQLVEALERALDETVALRELLAALRGERPQGRWEEKYRVALTALADRLRGLAETVERGGVPLRSTRSVQVGDDVRDGIVGSALAVQVRRIIGRLDATIDGAAEIVARGLKVGFDTPLPGRSAGGWERFREAVATRSPGFRHAARVGTAIATAMALDTGLRLPHGHWLPITVMFCLRDSYGDTVERVVKRVGGAAVGGTVAALALAIAPGRATLLVLVFVGAMLGFALASVNHTYWVTFGTPMVMLLIDFTSPLAWRAAAWRVALTVAGGLIALVAARTLWPAGTRRLLPARLARLLRTHAATARALAARFDGDDGAPLDKRLRDAASAAVDVEDPILRLAREPAPPAELLHRLREATAVARRLRDYQRTLGALAEEAPDDVGPIPAILERVAHYLDSGADALLSGERQAADLDLGDLLGEFDDHLSSLCEQRRARGPEATLRTALIEAAGARHALRALTSDADLLRKESQRATADQP